MTDRFYGSAIFNAFSASNSQVHVQSVNQSTFSKLTFQGGVSAIGGAYSPYVWSATNVVGGTYTISGTQSSVGPVALALATLVQELINKGILRGS